MSSGTGNRAFVSVEIQNSKFTCCEKLPVDVHDGNNPINRHPLSILEKICAYCCCCRWTSISNNVEESTRSSDGEVYQKTRS